MHTIIAPAYTEPQPLLAYPPKPEGATHFQRHYGHEPATVIRWEWSDTFGRWGAVVQFADGQRLYTWPKPDPLPEPAEIEITYTADEFGTVRYSFEYAGAAHECFDFPTHAEAEKGARFHLHCLANNLPHEVADGLGAIYRP